VYVREREADMGAYACPLPMLFGIYTNYHTTHIHISVANYSDKPIRKKFINRIKISIRRPKLGK